MLRSLYLKPYLLKIHKGEIKMNQYTLLKTASITFFVSTMFSVLASQPCLSATFSWKATNNSGVNINALKATFTGTGGTINNPMILSSPVGGGNGIAAMENMVFVFFEQQIKPGQMFTFKFDVDFDEVFYDSGSWFTAADNPNFDPNDFEPNQLVNPVLDLNDNPINPTVVASAPEPTSTLGLLAFGTLGTGSTLLRKKQQHKSVSKITSDTK